MSGTTKRLDLRFGAFACSVQGFDDPVQPVQQVLRAIQHLLEETPDLTDAGISLDAEAIENLIEEVARRADLDEGDVEIAPGLIIVHRGGDSPAAREMSTDEEPWREEAWSRPSVIDDGPAAEYESTEALAVEDASGDQVPPYVNIFAAAGGAETAAESAGVEEVGEDAPDTDDPFTDRLDRIAAEEPEEVDAVSFQKIFSEASDAGGSVFVDPMAERSDPGSDHAEPINLFAAAGPDEEADTAAPAANLFGASAQEPERTEPLRLAEPEVETSRVRSLFGGSEDDPLAAEPTGEQGYTAAGLAERVGAETVPDLMVSAAAWMVLLQGQTSFTRREVIEVFETIPGDHPTTLEARIKGFDKAVRNGQLIMVEDGVFGLARAELDRYQSVL